MNLVKNSFAILGLALSFASSAVSADLTADNCQIFIKKVYSSPGSHGSASFGVVVKTGWIGNGEHIEAVKFYGYAASTDLGNAPDCHSSPFYGYEDWTLMNPIPDTYYANQWGESLFSFPVKSGSVVSMCPGYIYTWVGTFLVQTNKNTYWLNPDLDADKHFHFDANAFRIISHKGGTFNPLYTDREDLAYYNPGICR
jgi:hypothetical protein